MAAMVAIVVVVPVMVIMMAPMVTVAVLGESRAGPQESRRQYDRDRQSPDQFV